MSRTPAPSPTSASRRGSTDLKHRLWRHSARLLALPLLGIAAGCGGNSDLVLAHVGDATITASEMTEFIDRLTDERKTTQEGVDGYLDYLQNLIDKEVLVQEAHKRGLHKAPAVWRKLKSEKDRRAVKDFIRRQTRDKITVTDEELRAHQLDTKRNYQVQMRRLLVDTEEDAQEAVRRLRAGEPFGHVATGVQSDSSRYFLIDELDPPVLAEMIFPLEVGEVSEPVFYAGIYGVYQMMDRQAVELEEIRPLLEQEVMAKKMPEFVKRTAEQFADEIDFEADEEALAGMVGLLSRGLENITAEEHSRALLRYRDGRFTVQDYVDLILIHNIGFGDDIEDRVRWFTSEVVVPHVILMEAARHAGVYDEPDFISWFSRREQALVLQEMRNVSLADIFVDDEEGRRYYEANPKQFVPMEELQVQEIMVETGGEAAFLLEQIEQGADMGALAAEHTVRPRGKTDSGRFHIHTFETGQFGDLIDQARNIAIGKLVGPIEVKPTAGHEAGGTYYSIFKVLQSTIGAGPEPYDDVKRRAKALVHRNKNNRAFYQFLLELRLEYEPRIEILTANVEELARQQPI